MDIMLQGLPKVICYLDDTLTSGNTPQKHLENLKSFTVIGTIWHSSMESQVPGSQNRLRGVTQLYSKANAILKAPSPRDVQEHCSFLGPIHYYV